MERVSKLLVEVTNVAGVETLQRWAHVGLPVALGVLFLCYCFGGAGKMMKAPGRGGRLMPRASFDGNPRAYFRDLRAG